MDGICIECGEHTSLEESCCGSGVWIEGSVKYPDNDSEDDGTIFVLGD